MRVTYEQSPIDPLPGPSSHHRIDVCEVSEALPHFEVAPHEYARLGNLMHDFLEEAYHHGREAALQWAWTSTPGHMEVFEMVPFERLPEFNPGAYAIEMSFAYDVQRGTSRILGQGLNRNEARAMAKPGEMVGTIDLGTNEHGVAFIVDWKTGWRSITPAQWNLQLKTYALMACRASGLKEAKFAIIRVLANGTVLPWDWGFMDEDDLDAHEAFLRMLMKRRAQVKAKAAAGEPLPMPYLGPHCDYCPALRSCPARQPAQNALLGTKELRVLTPDELGQAYRNAQQILAATKLAIADIKRMAAQSPIPLGGNRWLGVKARRTETIDPDAALEALRSRMGDVADIVYEHAVKLKASLTKKAFKSGLKKFWIPSLPPEERKVGAVEEEMLQVLRDGRAMIPKQTKPITEFSLKPSAMEAAFDNMDDEDESESEDEAA